MVARFALLLPVFFLSLSCGEEAQAPLSPRPPLDPAQVVVDKIRNLGTLGGPGSTAFSVNEQGDVVGASGNPGGELHGFLWTEREGMLDLGPGVALRINDRGQILFRKQDGYYLWNRETGFIPTGLDRSYSPNDLNNLGHLAGQSADDRAFLWKPESGPEILAGLGEGWSEAAALNDADEIAGYAATDRLRGPFLWQPGSGPVLIDAFPGALFSRPVDLNGVGQVLCTAFFSSGAVPYRAFLWSRDEGIVDIALGSPAAVNDQGHVVGTALQRKGGWAYAFYWEPETGMKSLRWLVPQPLSSRALDLNDSGQVVGASSWSQSGRSAARSNATLWTVRLTARPS